jgi:hypothetical protein
MLRFVARVLTARQHDLCGTAKAPALRLQAAACPPAKVDVRGFRIRSGREVRAPFVNCFTYAERGLSYQAPWETALEVAEWILF